MKTFKVFLAGLLGFGVTMLTGAILLPAPVGAHFDTTTASELLQIALNRDGIRSCDMVTDHVRFVAGELVIRWQCPDTKYYDLILLTEWDAYLIREVGGLGFASYVR